MHSGAEPQRRMPSENYGGGLVGFTELAVYVIVNE